MPACTPAGADPLAVRYRQPTEHAALVMKDHNGNTLASGQMQSVVHGDQVEQSLVFHFRDGSVDEETSVFRQGGKLMLVSDHKVQKGPSFPEPVDITIEPGSNQVTLRDHKDGKDEVKVQHMALPADLVNGMLALVAQNFPQNTPEASVSFLVPGAKPRLTRLLVHHVGGDHFKIGSSTQAAERYDMHFVIGGVAGVLAPMVGKQPPDISIWVMDGAEPKFLRADAPMFEDGPLWTLLLAGPDASVPVLASK